MLIFSRLRRWLFPTFHEWLVDMQNDFNKEMQEMS